MPKRAANKSNGKEGAADNAPYNIERVKNLLEPLEKSLGTAGAISGWKKLYLGFDLGTTNTVLVALNESGEPVAAEMEYSGASVSDGVVVDYLAAIETMKRCLERMERRLADGRKVSERPRTLRVSRRERRRCARMSWKLWVSGARACTRNRPPLPTRSISETQP